MALPTISCCYKGCGTRVWAPTQGELTVQCSSATCMTCRRVALCLEHFEAVREQQGDLRCPNCGGTRWHVVLFEPRKLPQALSAEVHESNGHVEVRFVSTGTTADLVDSLPPRDGADGEPHGWTLARSSTLPAGTRPMAPGVSLRMRGDGAHLLLDDGAEQIRFPGLVRSVGRLGPLVVVEGASSPQAPSTLTCFDGAHRRCWLASPFQLALRAPAVVDARRFVYAVERPDGSWELREARLGEDRRVETRRVGAAWSAPSAPTVTVQGARCVVFARKGPGYEPLAIDLETGAAEPLAEPGPPPLVVSAARDAAVVAWLDEDGDIRVASPDGARGLGRIDGDGHLLAVSHDGAAVAWIDHDLVVASTATGDTERRPAPDDVVGLSPSE